MYPLCVTPLQVKCANHNVSSPCRATRQHLGLCGYTYKFCLFFFWTEKTLRDRVTFLCFAGASTPPFLLLLLLAPAPCTVRLAGVTSRLSAGSSSVRPSRSSGITIVCPTKHNNACQRHERLASRHRRQSLVCVSLITFGQVSGESSAVRDDNDMVCLRPLSLFFFFARAERS